MAHSKYSDAKMIEPPPFYREHVLHMNGARRFNPTPGTSDATGPLMSLLTENSQGDWSWKPARDRASGYGKGSTFKTFLGVPPSAAELYRGQVFARA